MHLVAPLYGLEMTTSQFFAINHIVPHCTASDEAGASRAAVSGGVVRLSNNVVLCCINARCFLLYAGNFLSHIFPLFGISILPKNPNINHIEVCQAYTYQLGFFHADMH